ncbi:hypothetical protein B9G53_16030 [Pseudanabaena sp. SR411]|uniref:beta strand repeat-containing protein n=1 Tax=Pseudanabaena sp. SR411 TaxID=1980935 RepID=UPI000B99BBB6|nr:hypothetical protein [Pseudanabaena sp. SR411]OYQ63615.1 hypothetical protein B9G53_16030 [Pseudanabaena sp. SR411]
MRNHSKNNSSKSSFYRLIAATLTMGGVSLLMPLIASAQLTPANTQILNRATGTYEDPNNPGVPINTTSNEVTATVAEVAGLTNTPAGLLDINGGSVTTNDAVDYAFLITNVGNDPTAVYIPAPTIVGGTLGTTAGNAGALAKAGLVVTEINGIVLTTPVAVPASGLTTDAVFIAAVIAAGGPPGFNGSIPANGTIRVVVPVTVTETVAGNPVSVRLGNTGANDNSAGTQNQPDTGAEPPAVGADPATGADEVRTVNVGAGTPVNGVREAAAFTTVPLATAVNNVALATVLKTRVAYAAGTAALTDDQLTYRLDLRVENTPPAVGITPAPLLPTRITLNGVSDATTDRILISDAIPAQTTLDNTFGAATVTIGGVTWTRVYSTVATATGPLAVGQNWQTGAVPAAGVTRIGYVAVGPLPAGTTTVADATGFQFRVITTGVAALPVTIANIAQVFGQSTAGPISPTNPLVYDESGDQNPNNYEAGVPPAPITTPATSPTGVSDPANGTDPIGDTTSNNQGTGLGGENNVFTINPAGIILNGPPGVPGALGPDGTAQTDFVNKSATDVPPNVLPGSTYDPAAITFTNTVQNPATNTNQLDNVTLEPISATLAAQAVNNTAAPTPAQIQAYDLTNLANHAALPNGTIVRISFGGRTALYTLTAGSFVLTSSGANAAGTGDAVAAPIIIPTIAVGVSQLYTVIVDLPAGAVVTTGYSVPIVSYVNSNIADGTTFKTNGTVLGQDNPFNIKMDRVYTGYLNLVKASQILQGTGPAVLPADAILNGNPKTPAPGNIILYQITYSNISTPASGIGNVILNANNIVITEDGAAGTNNWATTTFNVASTAADATAGAVITFFNGATPTTTTDVNVTRYLDSIPTIAPGANGVFTFQRRVR